MPRPALALPDLGPRVCRRLARPLPPAPAGILPTELHSTNAAADNINAAELGRLPVGDAGGSWAAT